MTETIVGMEPERQERTAMTIAPKMQGALRIEGAGLVHENDVGAGLQTGAERDTGMMRGTGAKGLGMQAVRGTMKGEITKTNVMRDGQKAVKGVGHGEVRHLSS